MVSFVVACSSGFHSHAILLGAFLLRASFYLHNNHSSTENRTKMKIPVLASLALLLALFGAYDADASEEINLTDDRRLAYKGGEEEVGDCLWKWPYSYSDKGTDKCYKVKWCPSTDGKSWVKESDQEIHWLYCWNKGGGGGGGGGGSGSNKNLNKKCRRWERKIKQCKRHKATSRVSFVGLVSSLGAHVLMCSAHVCT